MIPTMILIGMAVAAATVPRWAERTRWFVGAALLVLGAVLWTVRVGTGVDLAVFVVGLVNALAGAVVVAILASSPRLMRRRNPHWR